MSAPKKDRNLEFYKRWRVNNEPLYKLLQEYGFNQTTAYNLKRWVEKNQDITKESHS